MIKLDLFKITDTSGKVTGEVGKVTYQALTDKEGDNLISLQGDYSYIGYDFEAEFLGVVEIPSMGDNE